MQRKLIGGLVVLVLAAIAVWFLWLRDRGDNRAPPKPDGSNRSAQITPPAKPPDKPADQPAPRMAPRWSLDIDPEGPMTLEGQVIGPDGKGVAKAEVWLGSVPPRTAVAEDDGTFSFDKLVSRTYSLSAKSGDLISDLVPYKLTEKADPAIIRLTAGAAIEVTVLDEAKKPIADVDVSSGFTVTTRARTDQKGEATIKPVSPGYAWVLASATGYAPGGGFTTVGSSGSTAKLTITMHKGYAIAGRVIDDAGKPIANAQVFVDGQRTFSFDTFEGKAKQDPSAASTDEKGQFKIAAVASGTHVLYATDGDHAPARSAEVVVDDRAVAGVEITMKAGGVVAGTVVDPAGKAIAYATVRIAGAGAQVAQVAGRQATTDNKGAFEIKGVARTKLDIRAESENSASKLLQVDLTEERVKRDLELVLDVNGVIAGVVVDDKGTPVAEVQVNAFPDILGGASTDGLALAGMSSATSDGDGKFQITGLPDGAYKLWAARPTGNFGGWGGQNVSAHVGDKAVKITLSAPGGVKGTIVIEGVGAPKVATAAIGWNPPTPAQDGKFEINQLDPGTFDVTIRGPEFAVMVRRDVKVEAGKVVDLGTITVYRGRKITGRVVDAKGNPVSGATVKVGDLIVFGDDTTKPKDDDNNDAESMGPIRSGVSDADGRFSIIGIAKTATNVAADHPTAGRSPSVPVPEGATDPAALTLKLRGFGSIKGTVTQKGKPMSGVSVTQSQKGAGAQLSGAQTDDAGNYTMKKVPEGTVTLQAMQQKMMSLKSTTVTVNVTAGKETVANIDIPVGTITLTVKIKPAAGAKVDAAQVFLFTGTVSAASGKQLLDSFVAGGAQGMKFWFGEGKPEPAFEELVPGEYSICSVPITGDMNDPQFMMRINENAQTLKVYCRQVKLAAQPNAQTQTQELPSMTPLPAPTN